MEIQLEKRIKVDATLELENPIVTIEQLVINLLLNEVTPTLRFDGKEYSYSRIIEPMEYKPDWTINDLEAYILKWITANEIK